MMLCKKKKSLTNALVIWSYLAPSPNSNNSVIDPMIRALGARRHALRWVQSRVVGQDERDLVLNGEDEGEKVRR